MFLVLPTQQMIADTFYWLKMIFVQGYKYEGIELIVLDKPEINPWHKNIIMGKEYIV